MDKDDTEGLRATRCNRCVLCICANLAQGDRPQSKALGHKEVAVKTYCKGRFAALLMPKLKLNLSALNQVLVQFWLLREHHQDNMLGISFSNKKSMHHPPSQHYRNRDRHSMHRMWPFIIVVPVGVVGVERTVVPVAVVPVVVVGVGRTVVPRLRCPRHHRRRRRGEDCRPSLTTRWQGTTTRRACSRCCTKQEKQVIYCGQLKSLFLHIFHTHLKRFSSSFFLLSLKYVITALSAIILLAPSDTSETAHPVLLST